jgi:tetratricopeptide (TPR) repeat protein
MKKTSKSKKPNRPKPKSKPTTTGKKTTRSGLPFELRARRAIAQVQPSLVVSHDEKLPTEYGVKRQFDVVGRSAAAVKAIYEARDKRRKVDVEQQEAFAMKVATLADKPERAGIISASDFTSSTTKWVQRYKGHHVATELYTLKPSHADDWKGDIREYLVTASFQTVQLTSVRLVPPAGITGRTTATVGVDRAQSFIRDRTGKIVGNLLDVVNAAMRDAQSAGDMSPRRIPFPEDSYIKIGGKRSTFDAVELELEQTTVPASTLVDMGGRFPDTLREVTSGNHWLIEDQERLPRFARSGRDLTLAFGDPDDKTLVDLDVLPIPDPDPVTGSTTERTIVSLQLHLALALAGRRAEDVASPEFAALLERARTAFEAGDLAAAEAAYIDSLAHGTALVALCNLAYIFEQRGDHSIAADYSLIACRMFPRQPHGFANAAAAFLAAGKVAEARRILDLGRALHGPANVFRRQEADLLRREGRWQDAARLYYEVLFDDPSNARVRACLARCEAALGDLAGAAWDARRAMKDAPGEPAFAEMASRYASGCGDDARLLEIATEAATAGMDAPGTFRRAAERAVAAGDHVSALYWVDQIPRASWSATDYAFSGQLASLAGDVPRAIEHLQRAESSPDTAENTRSWLAENLCRMSRIDEALSVLGRMEPLRADTLVIELLDRAFAEGRHNDCEALARWLMQRDTAVPNALLRQALVFGSRAIVADDTVSLSLAEDRLGRAMAASEVTAVELLPARLLIAMGHRNEPRALEILSQLPSDASEMYAAFVGLAERRGLVQVWARMLDRCLAAERAAPHIDLSALAAQRVGCGFRLGHDLEAVRRAIGTRRLSQDAWGQTAAAALAYAEGDVEECVRRLTPLMDEPIVPFPAPTLFGQALAELSRYDALQVHYRAFGAPKLARLARWASERTPEHPLDPLAVAAASGAAFKQESEFLGVALQKHIALSSPAADWAAALDASRKNGPTADAVWVVRRDYPREFLKRAFTSK